MTSKRYPRGGVGRRAFLAATAAALPVLDGARVVSGAGALAGLDARLGVPGPYSGRVVEVRNPAMIRNGEKNAAAVKRTLDRGLCLLTGADDPAAAWRAFFEPGDVVGIKMNPVGNPLANTSAELMRAVVDGVRSAGVKTGDLFVYDRYRHEFITAGMDKTVPDGVRWGGLTPEPDTPQLTLDWPAHRDDPIAGYDRDEFVEMNLIHEGHDPKDDRNLRSHLGRLITRTVNKLVLLPVLKDHGSAGVTGALKNMSHGSVNNVARSHASSQTNVCNQFVPEVVNHPILRRKCVLQVLDGIRGVFQGGPFGSNPRFIWDYNALFLATDPVALDHVEWRLIDAERKARGLPPVAATGRTALDPLGTEGFDVRQPQHIALAANLGLGVFDFEARRGGPAIEHRVETLQPA